MVSIRIMQQKTKRMFCNNLKVKFQKQDKTEGNASSAFQGGEPGRISGRSL
jgi:hypothetical protein